MRDWVRSVLFDEEICLAPCKDAVLFVLVAAEMMWITQI